MRLTKKQLLITRSTQSGLTKMKITKKQLRQIIREEKIRALHESPIDWFGLSDKVDALDHDQKAALDNLKESLEIALGKGVPPDTIRETIKSRLG